MFNKLKLETPDLTIANIQKIAALFPNVITEAKDENGNLKKGINFELLKQELSSDVVEYGEECYDFTWIGKKESIVEGNRPIRKTLRPCIEESVDFENTGNLYIEGDNLDVLKLLQESYLNQVKMIYIDPPYNTGKDFIYKDNFTQSKEEYLEETEAYDEDDNRLFQNTETNGRFHSDWCSMIYPRLKLAERLLTDDGVVFISIDDNEVDNLKKICNEVFGEQNFVAQFIWEKRLTRENRKTVSVRHDYILSYAKNFNNIETAVGLLPMGIDALERYKNPDNDYRGTWTSVPAIAQAGHGTKNQFYKLTTPFGREIDPPSGSCWRYTKERMDEAIKDNRIWFGSDGKGVPRIKKFLNEGRQGLTPETIWFAKEVGTNDSAKRELVEIFAGIAVFETPKPVSLIKQIIQICSIEDEFLVLDFFSGTSPTAHAVMQLNAEDGGNRKFIMVQLPEECAKDSEAAKAGYKNICEIGKERIRRAGKKINEKIDEENKQLEIGKGPKQPVDIGFRVLKVDSTNMKDVYYGADEYDQGMLSMLESNIKDDRTDLDLLYGVLLDWGLPLTMSHKIEQIEGVTVHTVDVDSLIACFAEKISESVIREIAKRQPRRVVFRDSSFVNSPDKLNVEEIFKVVAPNTVVRVI